MGVELTTGATEAPEPRLVLASGSPARADRHWAKDAKQALENQHGWFALFVYLAVAVIWDRSSIGHLGSVCACGLPGDPAQYAWSFVWFPHALLNGLSLLHTHAMWAPPGINLAGATATPFLAFLFAPITWIWGPIVSLDVAWIAAPVSAAWSVYWLCRYLTRAHWGAVAAGLAYGFGSYQVGQLNGHLHLVMIFCPPLVVLTMLQFLNADISRRRLVGRAPRAVPDPVRDFDRGLLHDERARSRRARARLGLRRSGHAVANRGSHRPDSGRLRGVGCADVLVHPGRAACIGIREGHGGALPHGCALAVHPDDLHLGRRTRVQRQD